MIATTTSSNRQAQESMREGLYLDITRDCSKLELDRSSGTVWNNNDVIPLFIFLPKPVECIDLLDLLLYLGSSTYQSFIQCGSYFQCHHIKRSDLMICTSVAHFQNHI